MTEWCQLEELQQCSANGAPKPAPPSGTGGWSAQVCPGLHVSSSGGVNGGGSPCMALGQQGMGLTVVSWEDILGTGQDLTLG